MPGTHAPVGTRFWRYVQPSGEGCWPWTGSQTRRGYGHLKVLGRPVKAHRISWELHFGAIPDGLFVCHHCDNPPCVRPDHLFLGTAEHNMRDMIRKGRQAYGTPERLAVLVGRVRKLTDEEIVFARTSHAAGRSSRSIARQFGVANTTISRLINGEQWSGYLT